MRQIFLIILHYISCQNATNLLYNSRVENCPDAELYDQCFSDCTEIYIDCLTGCDSSSCQSRCFRDYSICESVCPCGLECLAGCEECDHPLCESCENAETENHFYITCLEEGLEVFNACMKDCPPQTTCYEKCYQSNADKMEECPCVDKPLTTTQNEFSTTQSLTITTTLELITDDFKCHALDDLSDIRFQCQINCVSPIKKCVSTNEGCYQFEDECFTSLEMDWSYCADNRSWSNCTNEEINGVLIEDLCINAVC